MSMVRRIFLVFVIVSFVASSSLGFAEETVSIPASLTAYNSFQSDGKLQLASNIQDNLGNTYLDGYSISLYNSTDKHWIEYKIGGAYAVLTGTAFITLKYRSSDREAMFSVYGDGRLLYQSNTITGGVEPQDFTVDVSGVDKLRIEFRCLSQWSKTCYYGLGNMLLYKYSQSPQASLAKNQTSFVNQSDIPVELSGLTSFQSKEKMKVIANMEDNLGNTYLDCYRASMYSSSDEAWIEYKIDNAYSVLTGTVFIDFKYRSSEREAVFSVYGDGALLYQSDTITSGVEPQDFVVDVSGVDKLRIEFRCISQWGKTCYYGLGNALLQ